MHVIEQLTALALLIDFLFGITLGVVGGAIHGARHGVLPWPAAEDPLSAGARVIYGVYLRDDSGYLQGLVPGSPASSRPGAEKGSQPDGQEAGR
jgi:hypothetical protein